MAARRPDDNDDHGDHEDWHHDWHHGGPDHEQDKDEFDFELPNAFKIDLDDINLKQLGKITDYHVSHKELSVTFGDAWTLSIEGSGFEYAIKSGSKFPIVTGGSVDSFSIDGPGKADFSISDLDLSAKALSKAIANLDFAGVIDLVLGGDETISGSGFGDYLYGGKGNDTILGNDGADWLLGGNGDDSIAGGRNGDYLTGGGGDDTFTFASKSGKDQVADFDASRDVLDLSAYGFGGSIEEFLDGHVLRDHGQGNEDVVLDLGDGNMIKLEDVSRWDLNDSNILL